MQDDSAFRAHCERHGEAVVVSVVGELDLASAEDLRAVLDAPEAHAATVVLDLRRVSFIDSSGLSLIVGEHQRAKAAGYRLAVAVGTAPRVQRLFELTGLRKMLSIVPDPEAALAV